MLIDLLIVIMAISAIYRGREIGLVRQLFSGVGFFGGLLLGAWLEPHTVALVHTQFSRAVVTLLTTLGLALILLAIGETVGIALKHKLLVKQLNRYDRLLGSVASVGTLLLSVWLIAAIIAALPAPGLQIALRNSRVIAGLDRVLPPAPEVIAGIGHLIDPNGFPQVFIGQEPSPRTNINLPQLGELRAAVQKDAASVVKIEGQGCGGIVEGSGFVVAPGFVATNAHVVAGIHQPFVIDSNGTHTATAVWFDPNVDVAVLRTANLAGHSLNINPTRVGTGTPAAVLGYPEGGSFTASTAAVLDEFTAVGRNIYDRGNTSRDVYELKADVIPGNSGGPLINQNGDVIGVIFAESTTYNQVGYALTSAQVNGEISQAVSQNRVTSTGSCAG